MNKNRIKLALIGLAAGMCISAKATPEKKGKEVAFQKCTKEKDRRYDDCEESSNAELRNGYRNEKYKPKASEFAGKRKSAAQKVMEGY